MKNCYEKLSVVSWQWSGKNVGRALPTILIIIGVSHSLGRDCPPFLPVVLSRGHGDPGGEHLSSKISARLSATPGRRRQRVSQWRLRTVRQA